MNLNRLLSFHGGRVALITLVAFIIGLVPCASAGQDRATFLEPKDQATEVALPLTVRWTAVEDAAAYYLYVGTSPGAKDVVDTGEIRSTFFTVTYLPPERTLYARISTKQSNGMWLAEDVSFTAKGEPVARFLHPVDGALEVDLNTPFEWTAAADADAYNLSVGSTPGGTDLLESGDISGTSYTVPLLPPGQTVFARISTRARDGSKRWKEVSFAAAGQPVARFLHPLDGAAGVDPLLPFRWAPVPGAEAYVLSVGTKAGRDDLLETALLQDTTYAVTRLPAGRVLYARVKTKIGAIWGAYDVRFTLAEGIAPVRLIVPGHRAMDGGGPFEWSPVPLASQYRLEVGTRRGAHDLHDSGAIHVTRRFVEGLPLARPLYGRVSARVGDRWQATDFVFTVARNSPQERFWIDHAVWATGLVREMSDHDNYAFSWTRLWEVGRRRGTIMTTCADMAAVLRLVLDEMNMQVPSRIRDTCYRPRTADCHTLVEIREPGSDRWILLDPTFGLALKRTSDGRYATIEDMTAAARSKNHAAISYQLASSYGGTLVRGYYVPYPLLFLNPEMPRPGGDQ